MLNPIALQTVKTVSLEILATALLAQLLITVYNPIKIITNVSNVIMMSV